MNMRVISLILSFVSLSLAYSNLASRIDVANENKKTSQS
jgi:hypothetical protein